MRRLCTESSYSYSGGFARNAEGSAPRKAWRIWSGASPAMGRVPTITACCASGGAVIREGIWSLRVL